MPAKKSNAGRKKYELTPAIIKKVEQLASRGLMDKEIFALLGWSHDTFYKNKRDSTEFSEAIERGRATGHASVANKLFEACMGGHVSAMQYYLARRAGWREEKSESDFDGEVQPLTVNFNVSEPVDDIKVTRGK